MDYRDLVGSASLELCLHLFNPNSTSANVLLTLYKDIWNKAGTVGKRSSDIEHFDFLLDAYGQVSKSKSQNLLNLLRYLKTELTKIV